MEGIISAAGLGLGAILVAVWAIWYEKKRRERLHSKNSHSKI